jgi:hypothetical protein
MLGASNTPFRIKPPRLIADSATEDMAGNVYAGGLQKGKTAARDALQANAGKGFSVGANQQMYAGQAEAAGAAEGAKGAAAVRAEDQGFNSQAKFDNQMLAQQARLFDYGQMTDANAIGFDQRFTNQTNRSSIGMAQRQASQRLRLAMLGKGLA